MTELLTKEQTEFFHDNGYLLIHDYLEVETISNMKSRIKEILQDLSPGTTDNNSVFTTTEQDRKTDDYFLQSGDKIRFFWEEQCRDKGTGQFVQAPEDCVNKVGHALHDLDPTFQMVSYDKRVGMICRDLGLHQPLAAQSMYIFKQANIGGEVGPHQDGAFLYTEPQSVIGFWWALDHCYTTNGCLYAVPGSHKLGMHRRFKRRDYPLEGTEFEPVQPIAWDLTHAIPLEISAGTLVILHHSLVHYSCANTSSNARHAYSIHIIDGQCHYPKDNWLQKRDGPFNPTF